MTFATKRTLIIALIATLLVVAAVVAVNVFATNRNNTADSKGSVVTASTEKQEVTTQDATPSPVSSTVEASSPSVASTPSDESTAQAEETQAKEDAATDQMCSSTKKIMDYYLSKKSPDGTALYPSPESVYNDQNITQARGGVLKSQYNTCLVAGKI